MSLGIAWVPGLCPSSRFLKNITFRKLEQFLSPVEVVGDSYWDGAVRNSYPQSLVSAFCWSSFCLQLR
jgi:hypothetical protein